MSIIRLFVGIAILLLFPLSAFSQQSPLADSLYQRGQNFYATGNYKQAEFYLENAFKLYKKNGGPETWLLPGIHYAEVLVDRSKYDKALELFNDLNHVAISKKNMEARANIENDLGWLYMKREDNEKAMLHLKKAFPLSQQVHDSLRMGYINDNIATIYSRRGNYIQSLSYHKKALAFYQQLQNQSSIAIALSNIGLAYKKLLLYDKAETLYQQSLTISKKINNIDLQASTYSNLASLYQDLNQYDKALINYQKGFSLSKKAGNPSNMFVTLNNIGILYNTLGQPERALEYYRKSLRLKKQFAGPSSLSFSYINIAGRLWDLGKHDEAVEYYQQALDLRKQAGNPVSIAYSHLDLTLVKMKGGDFKEAARHLKIATHLADSTQNSLLQSETALAQGNLYYARHNFKQALTWYNQAYTISKKLSPYKQIKSLERIAYTYDKLGSQSTIVAGEKAIKIIEKTRAQTGPISKLKTGYFKKYAGLYMEVASWILTYRPEDISSAYYYIEAAKARSLTDELAQAAQQIDESLPEEERLRRAQKNSAISVLYNSLEKAKNADIKKGINDKIRQKELAYASYEYTLQNYYPQYKTFKTTEAASLKNAQELCDANTAILEYGVGKNNLLVFFITHKKAIAKRIPINQNTTLADEVFAFRSAIVSHAPLDSLRVLSEPIYEKLIAPLEPQLADYNNLLIVPDQSLAYLPFEALNHNTNYLINQYNIKYMPSITGYKLVDPPSGDKDKLLAIANSNRENIPLLPSAGLEITSVASLFNTPTMLKNKQLHEGLVKAEMQKNYNIIHIASHSIINEKYSSQSGVYLKKPSSSASKEDGFLRSSEIYGLHLSCNLVVLSACQSGLGKHVDGEGILGLQRAFLNAGASSVVVSLWDVYDRSTSHFMPVFYKALMQSQNRSWYNMWIAMLRWTGWDHSIPFGETAAAMRQAKLSMIQSPRYNHPVYWAPFIVIGR